MGASRLRVKIVKLILHCVLGTGSQDHPHLQACFYNVMLLENYGHASLTQCQISEHILFHRQFNDYINNTAVTKQLMNDLLFAFRVISD